MSDTSKKWWIIVTIMTVAILEVLDSTIVNVALPDMMASLGATQNQITWVLTSYVVASAIMLPLTGFISNRLGRKQMMIINISGFLVSSMLAGIATSLPEMVVFRLFQGAFGAALIPLSQAIMRQTFPPAEQGKAMAIWGLGIMAAPIFGPTLGGIITEHLSWRWIFYVNVPICTIALLMTLAFVPKTKKMLQKIDFLGLFFMVIGVGALQLMLDQGNERGWFTSNYILLLAVLASLGVVLFIIRGLTHRNSVVNFHVFKNRNFTLCSILMMLFAGCLFGVMTLEPIMLERLFHIPVITTGMLMGPMGLASAIGMGISVNVMKYTDVRYGLTFGLCVSAIGAYMLSHMTLAVSPAHFILPNALMGFGIGSFIVPLATYSLLTLDKKDTTEGAGLFSYGRMLGTSIGISLMSTLISQETQINWVSLMSHIKYYSANFMNWLGIFHSHTLTPKIGVQLNGLIAQHAGFQAFLDAFHLVTFLFLGMIVLVWFIQHVDVNSMEIPH